ncbi:phage portal protein [Chelativorans sp. ZYF759]|uniref:phage portal protein n=1 Tax=Chelativorans sp. ZYF759 TaxID=2692213 RepID=UPI00145F73F0|nr:phage portal protein [Chelativorans sp. ZYF759]NMG39819.1 phage portal protein [Chelativorans sp. ZYF759]
MSDKVRTRVRSVPAISPATRPTPRGAYLRDTRSSIISTRPAYLRDHRDEVRAVWRRTAGIALDLIQNSGRLRGAADQVIADTVGVELVLNPQPDLVGLGYSEKESADLIRLIKREWKRYSWNPRECDLRGKFTVPQMIDIALRWDMAYGEAIGVMSYMPRAQRQRYGIVAGTKMCMVSPTKLVQDTNEIEGMFQGVIHDTNQRPIAYRFQEKEAGIMRKRDHLAYDRDGRQVVVHVFDPMDADDVRGISRIAPAFRQHIQHETLVDATIQTAILQTVFAAALTSEKPSAEAFEALEAIEDKDLKGDYLDFFKAQMERAAESEISVGSDPRISQLAPGEKLELLASRTPGPEFLPVSRELSREMARAIGISFGGFTMNHENATYSSVRMENSSIWPVVVRRRERLAAPIAQAHYENWFDEEVGEGRIPVKGGYAAFAANRDKFSWALWQGPAKPTADDFKSAKASTERMLNGTSTVEDECGELGKDPDEVFDMRLRLHKRYLAEGMQSPYERRPGRADSGEEDSEARRERANG